jgi:uncharacterized protein CbrC (UPF0167 family)
MRRKPPPTRLFHLHDPAVRDALAAHLEADETPKLAWWRAPARWALQTDQRLIWPGGAVRLRAIVFAEVTPLGDLELETSVGACHRVEADRVFAEMVEELVEELEPEEEEPQFRYVDDPTSTYPEAKEPCALCGSDLNIRFGGGGFRGARDVDAVCLPCIAAGLPDDVYVGRDTDSSLPDQIRARHPDWTDDQVVADDKAKRRELQRRTPPVLSWQPWEWPACCGDLCRFLQHAGRADLDERAASFGVDDGRALLAAGLVKTGQPADRVWGWLHPDRQSAESDDSPQAYLFRCLHCGRPRIQWDSH